MGHLGDIFLLIHLLSYRYFWGTSGHSLPACQDRTQFRCSSGRCVPGLWICDGDKDCEDGSDELRCSERACQGFLCEDGGCVARSGLCDGTSDCVDGTDESQLNCGLLRCKKDEFPCHSRRCVSLRFRCDGVDDCGDGSDEASCQNCTADFFLCGATGSCLPRTKLCDGQRDCPDGQDEEGDTCQSGPPLASPACSASEFHCGDGQCVPHSWRCDHLPDCPDGSDEDNCDQNECLVNNGGCSHMCVDQEMGFICACPHNMKLVSDNQCEEIDQCLESDVCSQLCVHINGTLFCDCHEGYQMSPKTGECKARGAAARLFFSSSQDVRWISVTGSEYRELAFRSHGPGPMAALDANRTVYWAVPAQGSIYRFSMDGETQEPVLVLKGRGSVLGLAVDWIHQLVYWVDAEAGSVNAGLLDGSAKRQLIGGLDKPSAMAVDPLQGHLFWAENGKSPKIERASLDGQDKMSLVTSLIRNPVALSLDMPRQLLYWADLAMRTISRVGVDGKHRKTVVASNGYLDRPFGLAVFEGRVYWSDKHTNSICSANKNNGSSFSILTSGVASPGGLVVVHPVLQPSGQAVCGRARTVCQHQCIPDLFSEAHSPRFRCSEPGQVGSVKEDTTNSSTVPEPALSNAAFAGILALIVFLSALLMGMGLWWWREELSPSRSLTIQSFTLKESQDPLLQGQARGPPTCPVKETLLKLDMDQD